MRRIVTTFLSILVVCVAPAPAHAWWEFIEELSGPGRWTGPTLDARLFCLADDTTKQERVEAARALTHARAALAKLRKQELPTPQRNGNVTNVDVTIQAWNDNLDQWNKAFAQWERLARRRSASKVADIDQVFFPQGQLGRSRVNFRSTQNQPGPPDLPMLFARVKTAADSVVSRAGDRNAEPNTQAKIEYNAALAAYEREAKDAFDAAGQELQKLEEATDALTSLVGVFFVAGATPGFIISACKLGVNERRKAAFDIGMRFVWTKDDRFAGGQKIHLNTFEPAFSWRLIDDPRFDVVDYGVGAGFYWISSEAFPAVRGTFLEPVRLDLHAPTNWKYASAFIFRFGVLNFPAGFEPDVFLPGAGVPRRIPSDWVKSYGIFIDSEVFRKRKARTATSS